MNIRRATKFFREINLALFLAILLIILSRQLPSIAAATVADTVTPIAIAASPSESREILPSRIAEYALPDWARLVDILTVNPKIKLDIRYATTNNFVRKKLYPEARCILRSGVAQKLSQVQQDLQKKGLGLKVFDCYRPLSVTKQMWEAIRDPRYVANPAKGSRHNRGAAIDLTLVDRNGKELAMPTGYDNFTARAGRNYSGNDVSSEARRNSQMLEDAMKKYGFLSIPNEWWHFDYKDWQQFAILDIPFNQIPKTKRTK